MGEIAPQSITTLQFGLYQKPITNHEQKEREKEDEEMSHSKDEYLSESDSIQNIEMEQEQVITPSSPSKSKTPTLTQSTTIPTSQNIPDEPNSSDYYRRPIPDKSPPPIPPVLNKISNVDQINGDNNHKKSNNCDEKKNDNDDIKEDKDSKKTKNFAVSLTKPKNWMIRAMQKLDRFGGGNSPRIDSDKEEKKIVTNQSNKESENNNNNELAMKWDLANNIDNDAQNGTDDEEYIQ